ncbi:hypothetical protein TIFTF001_025107 [Ficus carica]|uniref:Uncharacterized protein n=1 Tax=Ficus carica TaxID=3494 RepID=A0AA88DFA8_FICCA|nr:hypothetical protein TIFTF001_025107 [Ficus carica]
MRPSVEICSRDRDHDMLARPRWLRSPISNANSQTMKSRSQTPDFAELVDLQSLTLTRRGRSENELVAQKRKRKKR